MKTPTCLRVVKVVAVKMPSLVRAAALRDDP